MAEDYITDALLEKSEQKILNQHVNKLAAGLIKNIFVPSSAS